MSFIQADSVSGVVNGVGQPGGGRAASEWAVAVHLEATPTVVAGHVTVEVAGGLEPGFKFGDSEGRLLSSCRPVPKDRLTATGSRREAGAGRYFKELAWAVGMDFNSV